MSINYVRDKYTNNNFGSTIKSNEVKHLYAGHELKIRVNHIGSHYF